MGSKCARLEKEPLVQAVPVPNMVPVASEAVLTEQQNLALNIAYVSSSPQFMVEVTRDRNILVRTDICGITFEPHPVFDVHPIVRHRGESFYFFNVLLGSREHPERRVKVTITSGNARELQNIQQLVTHTLMGFVIFVPRNVQRSLQGEVLRVGELQIVLA